ncbi:CoA-binding protein [Desertifilum sp. FACHB-1129]|uniref:CoA-binding protein n=1 Tax=Desertifilum tharense IPPAS B-1220 TaxID=1781255 RepID=A0A1E5QMD1_9CYAN|nr:MULTISPECIES: CoA-binding protein [unclassified Desertifilum]MDA0210583.1 CoA-binding protein [Cyanobacteria bacterium FC1]MDI9639272.1 CoA-binding protein [Geitlerinema splendidum]MDL5047916.1 CoA-binding protein [Oscillatoria amoena NRMC-F 0135]OEJ75839.1 CoA-binding protein [Desertifilum tharense IPPAS B-1220]MBD2311584.1 CoA-binding protein [Desertifilum sp. FACHB-1129]
MNFDPDTKVLVQGIVEPLGSVHAALMKEYGTNIVAGVSPGYGGQEIHGIPVFDLVEQAIPVMGAIDTSIIFVPPYQLLDAALEAIAAGIRQIIIVTTGIPPLDMVQLVRQAEATDTLVVGPNCPGIIVPGKIMLGTHPGHLYLPGSVGVISCTGTLTYEIAYELTQAGIGQSIVVGMGSDAIVGSSFSQWLQMLDEDEHTEAIVIVGETGGNGAEENAAHYIAEAIDKPAIAYLAGQHTPQEKRRGHAATLIASKLSVKEGLTETDDWGAERKIQAFKQHKIPLADRPSTLVKLVKKALSAKKK